MADKQAVKSFLWGTLAGVVAGAVAALLLAPKPGKELRGDIAETAGKISDKTVELGHKAEDAVQSLIKKVAG